MTQTAAGGELRSLSGKQARFLRGLGHGLEPRVTVGKEGVTEAVVASLKANLEAHELVKVRIGQGCARGRHEVAEELAARTGSRVAQVLGRTVLVYRAAEEPEIALP